MTRRRFAGVAAWVAIGLAVAYAIVASRVYLARVDPDPSAESPVWVLGPNAEVLNAAARRHLEAGVQALEDGSREPPDRVRLYQRHLSDAESLLVRSLRAQPAQAWVLAKLAAIRWELDPPDTGQAREHHLEIIRLASNMAPYDPAVQRELGRLLLMTGLREDGAEYLRRAVELRPEIADAVVELMSDFFFTPEETFGFLPRSGGVLAALREPFFRAGSGERYVALLELELASGVTDRAVIRAYGEASRALGSDRRTIQRLDDLGGLANPADEAERSIQLAFALLGVGSTAEAVQSARRAAELEPASERYREQLGVVSLHGNDPDSALEAFREALALAARAEAPPRRRGLLYRRVGQALDRLDRPDEAYDAYRMALELHPEEAYAARRMREMEEAAGIRRGRAAGVP